MKKYKRALSLLLIICIMCCAVFGSVEFSNALVLNPWTIAVCGALLTAAGLSFSSSSDMEAAAGSFAGSVSASIMSDLQAKAEEYKASNDNGFFLTLGADIIAAISGWLSGLTASEGGSVVVSPACPFDFSMYGLSFVPYIGSGSSASSLLSSYGSLTNFTREELSSLVGVHVLKPEYGNNIFRSYSDDYVWKVVYDTSSKYAIGLFPVDFTDISSLSTTSYAYLDNVNYFCFYALNGIELMLCWFEKSSSSYKLRTNNSFAIPSSASYVGSFDIPFDDVWAPGSSDESKALVPGASVKLPKGLVQDGVLDSDVIGAMTPESVRAGTSDIPDVIAGTGTITSTGEGTGIFEGIGSLVLDIPIIGTIASTLSEILEAIKGFFDVSRFDLNFESLKVGLTGVFPFCIPFDFFNAVKMFSSDASSFVFDINLETEYFTIDHTVDLTPFRLPILFFRYVVVFWFGFILISRTKDFMKW